MLALTANRRFELAEIQVATADAMAAPPAAAAAGATATTAASGAASGAAEDLDDDAFLDIALGGAADSDDSPAEVVRRERDELRAKLDRASAAHAAQLGQVKAKAKAFVVKQVEKLKQENSTAAEKLRSELAARTQALHEAEARLPALQQQARSSASMLQAAEAEAAQERALRLAAEEAARALRAERARSTRQEAGAALALHDELAASVTAATAQAEKVLELRAQLERALAEGAATRQKGEASKRDLGAAQHALAGAQARARQAEQTARERGAAAGSSEAALQQLAASHSEAQATLRQRAERLAVLEAQAASLTKELEKASASAEANGKAATMAAVLREHLGERTLQLEQSRQSDERAREQHAEASSQALEAEARQSRPPSTFFWSIRGIGQSRPPPTFGQFGSFGFI